MPELYLSRDVSVASQHVIDLKSYHISAVRSLHEAYTRKFTGKLLTYSDEINVTVILRAFLSAIFKEIKSPVLVLCEDENVARWHYELSKLATVKVFRSGDSAIDFRVADRSVTICSLQNLKDLQNVSDDEWSIVVTENVETVVNKLAFKRIGGARFKVALSKIDFTQADDLKVFWHVLNWCNLGMFGKLIEFSEAHREHYDNLRDPYDDIWYRIEWDLPENYLMDVQTENKEYNKLVREWGKKNNIDIRSSTVPTTRRSGVKRKLEKTDYNTKNRSSENNESESTNDGVKKLNNDILIKRKAKTFDGTPKNATVIRKVKSADDIDSIKLLLEDSWIEDFMKDMDIPETPLVADGLFTEKVENGQNKAEETERTPKSSQTTQENEDPMEEHPILEAIINGSPLKSAVRKQMFNMLGIMRIEDDLLAFSQQIRKSQELIVSNQDVSPSDSKKNDNLLTFLFGDQAAIVNEHKCRIFDD